MENEPAQPEGDRSDWNPGRHAIWSQRRADPHDSAPTTLLLRHPSAPFTAVVGDLGDSTLQTLALDYLRRANTLTAVDPPLALPDDWLAALGGSKRLAAAFGWLPIKWPLESAEPATPPDPYCSFRAERRSRGELLPEQTIILMASERAGDLVLGSEFGLRVVIHAGARRRRGKTEFDIRVTGLSASLPFGDYLTKGASSEDWSIPVRAATFTGNLLDPANGRHSAMLNLENVQAHKIRIARSGDANWKIERRGTGRFRSPIGDDHTTTNFHFRDYPYSFVTTEVVSADGEPLGQPVSIRKQALFADARPGDAQLFPIDPASQDDAKDCRQRRPTRSEKILQDFLKPARVAKQRHATLQLGSPEKMRTTVARRFVLTDRGSTVDRSKTVDLPGTGPEIRSNDFSAVSAFRNVEDFFDRLDAYGIDANSYFRMAKLPLKVAYRSGVEPGPGKDGQVVNARVIPDDWSPDIVDTPTPGRPALQLHLAIANLRHRQRKPWDGRNRSPAEPLGIAADPRWIWHEMGHVILMASIGELEFRFAHSPGDALAAIAMDPHSKLASNANSRGLTFPWVFLPRRHDRSVLRGWSWCGTMHSALAQAAPYPPNRRKAYRSEQILSSSLFRLYRCLGGDTNESGSTKADTYARAHASHYAIYLIFRAIQLMGTSGITVGSTPDDFVSALIDADIGTHVWNADYPVVGGETYGRIGGCAHKAVRWAFEAQGLYGPAGIVWNAPGLPPPVDIYIADARPTVEETPAGDIDYGPGNYLPVSLQWDLDQDGDDAAPTWQSPSTIEVNGDEIRVRVGNRGNEPADHVRVGVWIREWPANTAPPTWQNGAGWTACSMSAVAEQTIAGRGQTTFGPFTHRPPASRYLILAQAACEADPANSDPATGLPCSHLTTNVRDLIAGDNNLALRVVGDL